MSVPTYVPYKKIVHRTRIDLVGRYIVTPVHVVQGDHELPIVAVDVFENSVLTDISNLVNSVTAEINIRCRDKRFNTVYMSVLGIDPSGKTIYFEVTDNMTKTPGEVELILEIKVDGQIAQSSRIVLDVDRNPIQKIEDQPDVAGSMLIMNWTRRKYSVMNSEFAEVDYVLEEAG